VGSCGKPISFARSNRSTRTPTARRRPHPLASRFDFVSPRGGRVKDARRSRLEATQMGAN